MAMGSVRLVRGHAWLGLVGVVLVGLLSGCAGTTAHTEAGELAQPDTSTLRPQRYLALGDSYTIGESVKIEERYPVQLVRRLNEAGLTVLEPEIVARTGWTTAELAAGIEQAELEESYDLVTLLIGVNNQYRGYALEAYRSEFKELLARAIVFAGGDASQVIVLSIPDWGVTPFAALLEREQIAAEIDLFNEVNREESLAAGVTYIDITEISRRAVNEPALIADDGLHPSGKMYAAWVEVLLPAAVDCLSKP